VIVTGFAIATNSSFNFEIFMKWGIILALFGTIFRLYYLMRVSPTGIGLGSIASALELPVSVLMAYFLLNER
jgi:hypothetical protein